jgi:hypothetical protein
LNLSRQTPGFIYENGPISLENRQLGNLPIHEIHEP